MSNHALPNVEMHEFSVETGVHPAAVKRARAISLVLMLVLLHIQKQKKAPN
ncbi:hypothetical protein JZ785_06735 [Alicyclobacillus curvatus]|nr:hypothetical protein JZ785_06735 [Alicyclobacillus curvatus]